MPGARPGAAIEWLLRPWIERRRAAIRAGRIAAFAGALILAVVPSMILYYGLDDWWWDATAAVCVLSLLGTIAFDSVADVAERVIRRPITGLPRVGFLVVGLAIGILGAYLLLLADLPAGRTVQQVLRDYRRTMSILLPIVGVAVIAGASLWYRAEAYRLQGAAAAASFAVLKGQMQPHFLFNAMSALKELALDDPERASAFAQRIADLYRLILAVSTSPTSSLAHEAAIVENYLEVERVRCGERLRYHIDVPEDLLAFEIPSLVLQTLAENAVRHGIAKARAGGEVRVRASRTGRGAVTLEVSNTGAPYAPATAAEDERAAPPLGLANTRARLALMYGAAARLAISSEPERGTVVRVVVPAEAAR